MTLWIIIGALVFLVAIFLIVMSIKDRKKAKTIQVEKKELEKARFDARKNLILYLDEVIKKNDKLVKDFVPSVGKLKMGDIRAMSKKALVSFKNTREYKFAQEAESNKELINLFKELEHTNSNIWSKKYAAEFKELKEARKGLDKAFVERYSKTVEKLIKDVYK